MKIKSFFEKATVVLMLILGCSFYIDRAHSEITDISIVNEEDRETGGTAFGVLRITFPLQNEEPAAEVQVQSQVAQMAPIGDDVDFPDFDAPGQTGHLRPMDEDFSQKKRSHFFGFVALLSMVGYFQFPSFDLLSEGCHLTPLTMIFDLQPEHSGFPGLRFLPYSEYGLNKQTQVLTAMYRPEFDRFIAAASSVNNVYFSVLFILSVINYMNE